MNYASVCSGAEAFGPAWHELGFKPVFHAEIEPHASAVLRYHNPTVPNYGDFTQIATPTGPRPDEPVRLLCGGTPCQTYSVAGLREGLDSYKGGLTLEFVKLAKRLNADWLLWENVPGVLSADGGRAFGTFLGTLAECGYGFAYRVLDLQHFGAPQRRKRVFLVAHSGGDWQSCAAVLFESESLRGNPAPRRQAGQDVTGTLSSRTNAGGGLGTDFDCAGGLVATANTLKANSGRNQIEETYIPTCYDENQITSKTNRSNPQPGGVCHTLPASPTAPLLTSGKAFQQNSRDEVRYIGGDGQLAGALCAEVGAKQQNYIHVKPAIALKADMTPKASVELAFTLAQPSPTGGGWPQNVCQPPAAVRRLVPVETERLMGWQDNWTKYGINAKGKQYELADGPRYRICGNGWGQPVVSWIANRILMVDALLGN